MGRKKKVLMAVPLCDCRQLTIEIKTKKKTFQRGFVKEIETLKKSSTFLLLFASLKFIHLNFYFSIDVSPSKIIFSSGS